jgi:hypothetical protein
MTGRGDVYVEDMKVTLSLLTLVACAVALSGCAAGTKVRRVNLASQGGSTATAKVATSTDCGFVTQTYAKPPAGFDPTTATSAQLKEYGFPPRPPGDPSDPQVQGALKAWLTAMKSWRSAETAKASCGGPTHPSPPPHSQHSGG